MNELVDLDKKSKKYCLIFKLDFEKSYNSVSWSFLNYMFSKFGFNDKLRGRIPACVFFSSLTILVNGFPTQETSIQMRLKAR